MTSAPEPVGTLASISIDCADPAALADFYAQLLALPRVIERADNSLVALSAGSVMITLMRVDEHRPPTWPDPERPKQMHLDVSVTDLPGAVERAVALGAREGAHQAMPDRFRVMLDPEGHPFCLTTFTR